MTRKTTPSSEATDHVVVSVEINARRRQIEVTTMRRGRGRHARYTTLNQVPPDLRGEALQLVRDALLGAGYESLAELDDALTSDLVLPEEETEE